MADGQWYWCLDHQEVEPYQACRAAVRLGPYDTREQAQEALAQLHVRNQEWDNDPQFNDIDDFDD